MIIDLLLTQDLQERSAIIKVKVLFSGSTSPRMEKEHLAKLAPASQLRFFIFHNLATS
jgi:hypothetical protein